MDKKTKEIMRRLDVAIIKLITKNVFPNLNAEKIADFQIRFLEKVVNIVLTVTSILLFIYIPRFLGLSFENTITLFVAGIAYSVAQINKKTMNMNE